MKLEQQFEGFGKTVECLASPLAVLGISALNVISRFRDLSIFIDLKIVYVIGSLLVSWR